MLLTLSLALSLSLSSYISFSKFLIGLQRKTLMFILLMVTKRCNSNSPTSRITLAFHESPLEMYKFCQKELQLMYLCNLARYRRRAP